MYGHLAVQVGRDFMLWNRFNFPSQRAPNHLDQQVLGFSSIKVTDLNNLISTQAQLERTHSRNSDKFILSGSVRADVIASRLTGG